jgi:branched-chain amino acid transport system substrate-binding protein
MSTKVALLALSVTLALTQHAVGQVSDNVVRIGLLTDYTGVFSALSGQGGVVAARMAVEDFGGTVLGKPIEIVQADHGNKPDTAAAIAKRWYDVEGVDMIADVPNSSVALAVQAVARERQKIVIASGSGTAEFTGKSCTPSSFQWTWDTYSAAVATTKAVMQNGGESWYILAADYTFGRTMAADVSAQVKKAGGTVADVVRHPLNTLDFSSFIVQAQASKAKVVALANGGTDTVNAVKQFNEFGLRESGVKLVGMAVFITDVHGMGLENARGLILTNGFYWDRTDETRAWSKRFFARHGAMPTMAQAGVYSAVMHYLKSIASSGTDDGVRVAAEIRAHPVADFFANGGRVREDGRLVHDMYLVEVKNPDEVKYPWDYYRVLRTIPGEEAVRPLAESECPLVQK